MTESVTALGDKLLAQARAADSGRTAHTLVGGSGHALRQTLLALRASQELAEHQSPGEATVLVLRGKVELRNGDQPMTGAAGDLLVVPPQAHSLWAAEDSVVLLTVAMPR
jgi:quercetin dioxygenase-like cupin family protein